MNRFETLLNESESKNLLIIEKDFKSNAKGLCKGNKIGLNANIETTKEKTCILAEEVGHYETTVGAILNQRVAENRKQEFQARMYAYNKLIGLQGIIDCYEHGCNNVHEMAEYLEVTERFVVDALEAYEKKYGIQVKSGDYVIRFYPCLSVIKVI
nr:ImmA/IrrE family metallo-endopeptidase [uncultured Anaerostipes sp.]